MRNYPKMKKEILHDKFITKCMINLKIKGMNQMGLLVNNLEQVVTLKQQNKEPP